MPRSKAAQQQLDWGAAVAFLADAITGSVNELMVARDALLSLAEAWRARRRFRQHSGALRALELLASYPVVTAKRLAARLDVPIPAAPTAIEQLEQAGILQEKTGYTQPCVRRNRSAGDYQSSVRR